jgi:hypothetical protein
MKYRIGDSFVLKHGDGSTFEAKIIALMGDQYKLEAEYIPIPLYLSESVLEQLIAIS